MRNTRVCRCQSCVKGSLIISAMFAIFLCIADAADAGFSISKRSINNRICETDGCKDMAKILNKYMNASAKPCEDFYEYACGGFISSTPLPGDKGSISHFEIMKDTVKEQLKQLLGADNNADEIKPFNLAKTLYKACLDEDAIEAKGIESLLTKLDESGGWPVLKRSTFDEDNFDWASSMFEYDDATYLLSLYVYTDFKNPSARTIILDQPTFSLPYDVMLNGTDHKFVKAYLKYMVDIAVLLGADATVAAEELKPVLDLEIELSRITLSPEKRQDMSAMYHATTFGELLKSYPSISWKTVLDKLFSPGIKFSDDEKVIVWTPEYFTQLQKIMETTNKVVQANYVRWRVVLNSVPYLNKALRKAQRSFAQAIEGTTEDQPRWEECVQIVSDKLPLSPGAMYVRKHFTPSAKNVVTELMKEVQSLLKEVLQESRLFDEDTRLKALEKVDKIAFHIGYSEELMDDAKLSEFYENLELPTSGYHDMIMSVNKFETKRVYDTLRESVDKNDWRSRPSPASIDAFYHPIENSVQLPAGILQDIVFNEDRPKYLNYATVGYFMANMMTNGFDKTGSAFDADGKMADWWTPETKAKFEERVKCIETQYGNYIVGKDNLKLNGEASVRANVAGNGGLKVLHRGYENEVQKNEPEPLPSLPGIDLPTSQLFWLSLAAPWCAKYTDEALEMKIRLGIHVPEKYRIIGPFSNFEKVAKDFGCTEGSSIYRENPCVVW